MTHSHHEDFASNSSNPSSLPEQNPAQQVAEQSVIADAEYRELVGQLQGQPMPITPEELARASELDE